MSIQRTNSTPIIYPKSQEISTAEVKEAVKDQDPVKDDGDLWEAARNVAGIAAPAIAAAREGKRVVGMMVDAARSLISKVPKTGGAGIGVNLGTIPGLPAHWADILEDGAREL